MSWLAGLKGQAAAAATRKRNLDKKRGQQQQKAVDQVEARLQLREQRLAETLASPQKLQQPPTHQQGAHPMFPGDTREFRTGVRLPFGSDAWTCTDFPHPMLGLLGAWNARVCC